LSDLALDALAVARHLQRALRKLRVGDAALTTSIGYAVFPENGTTPDALPAAADSALWRSKHENRAAQAS
jgi:GGDEF domain-containing protein